MRVLTNLDIYVQNDFFDDVVDHPEKYNNDATYEVLYDVVTRHIRGFSILDYLLLDSIEKGYYYIVINNLHSKDLYDDYVDEVKNRDNPFILAYLDLFELPFELYEDFEDDLTVATVLAEYGDYTSNQRITGLLKLSTMENKEKTIKYIKKSFKQILSRDEDLVKEYTKTQINEEAKILGEQVDSNQRKLKLIYE